MAKTRKGSKYELDDYGFSNELDIPDFSFNLPEIKDDRKPVTKFAAGFGRGIKDTATSPTFVRKVVKNSLPKGYGMAIDLADEATGSLRSLYDNATKEIQPAVGEMKRFTGRVLPKGEKYLPKKVAEKLKKWSASSEEAAALSAEAAREQGIGLQLAEIFGSQMEESARHNAEADARDKLKEGMAHVRHRDMLSQLNAIRTATAQSNAYHINIGSKVARKSLELQFRQFFLQKDTYEEMRRFNAIAQAQLEAIGKNTGLPDYVKLPKGEALAQMLRNRFLGSMVDGVFDRRRNFVKNLVGNAGKLVMDKVSGFAGGVRDGLSMANMALDMQDSMGGMAPSGAEMAGGLAGSLATDFAGDQLSKRLGKRLAKNRKLVKGGNWLNQRLSNLPQIAGEWARSDRGFGAAGGMWDWAIGFAKDLVNSSLGGTATKLDVDNTDNINSQAIFTRHAHKSITEIIPGFLARIYQELQIMRTGDANIELTTYDYTSNKFASKSAAAKNAFQAVFGGWARKGTGDQIDSFIDKIDTQRQLTPEQRKELGQKLLRDNMNNRYGGKARLTKAETFGGPNGELYAGLFAKHLENDASGQKELGLTQDFGRLGLYVQDARSKIQNQVNAGMMDFLVDSGVINPQDGVVDMDRVYRYYYGEDYNPTAPQPTGRRGRRRRMTPVRPDVQAGLTPQDIAAMREANTAPRPSQTTLVAPPELLAAIQETNIRTEAQAMQETLLRIEQQLAQGVPSFSAAEMMDEAGSRMGNLMAGAKSRVKALDMSLRAAGGKLWGRTKGAGKRVFGFARNLAGGITNKLTTVGRFSLTGAKEGASAFFKKWKGEADVYIKGEVVPRLTAWKLKAGQYKDQATGKVIESFKDITGNVVDEAGNIVLTAQEAKAAFVRSGWGEKAFVGLTSLTRGAKNLVSAGLSQIPPMVKLAGEMLKKGWDALVNHPQDVYIKGQREPALRAGIMRLGGYISKRTGKPIKHPGEIDGVIMTTDGNIALSDDEIRLGLVNRFGQPIKSRLGSLLGLVGSGLSTMVRKTLAAGKWALGKLGGMARGVGGVIGRGVDRLTGGLLGLEGWAGGMGGGETTVDLLTQIRDLLDSRLPYTSLADDLGMGGAGGAAGGAGGKPTPKKPAGPAPKGFLGKVGHYGKVAGRGLLSGAKFVGRAGLGLLGFGGLGLGTAAAATGSALATGAGAIGTGLMAAGGAIATGIGAVLASPVLLGALAVGAVAGLGYLGYKYFTRKKLDQLSQVRYAQYGFAPSDKDHLQVVFGLEDRLEEAVSWSGEKPEIDLKKVDVQKVLDDFGINKDNTNGIERFANWFRNRFKPVFLTHLAALKAVAPDKKSLADIDVLKGAQKKRYFELSRFPEGPYNYTDSPFLDGGPLPMDSAMVSTLATGVAEELAKEKDDTQSPATKVGVAGAVGAAAGAAAVAKTGSTAGAAAPGAPTGVSPTSPAKAVQSAVGGGSGMISMSASFTGFVRPSGAKVEALTVIRFKTYGLHEMVTEKVRALEMLEIVVGRRLKFNAKGQAMWEGSIEAVLQECGPGFGVTGFANDAAYDWMSWFNKRFLPVFLNYATGVASATGKTDLPRAVDSLKAEQMVDAATAVYTTAGAWSTTTSPWPGYVLNSEVRSIEGNFQALKELAKKQVQDEQVGAKKPGGTGQDNGAGMTDGTNGAGKSIATKAWDTVKDVAGSVWNKIREVGSKIGTGFYDATHDSPSMLSGGRGAGPIGEGEQGALADLPMPRGDGKWEYFKELFEKVAKIVGINPKLMATMAAIESGFRSAIKAPTSSATGLFQFVRGTWNAMMRKYGAKFGIPAGTPPTDPRANALLGAAFIKENMQALRNVKPDTSDTDVYMAHFLGAGGAKKFFRAKPDAVAADVMPEAARANYSIFYQRDGRARTIAEVYALMNSKVRSRGKQFGLDAGEGTLPVADPSIAQAPAERSAGGRGSINPPMAIPVSDQLPAPSADSSPTPSSSGAEPLGSRDPTNAYTDPAAQAAGSGFQPSVSTSRRAQDIAALQQAQRDEMAQALGGLGDTALQSLRVQTDMLTVLRSIEQIVGVKIAERAAQADSASASAQPARSMPRPPVSMAKMGA